MKATEFAYWLQGYFEIRDASTSPLGLGGMGVWEDGLSRDQSLGVLQKAATVEVGEGATEAKAGAFVAYVKTAFTGKTLAAATTELKEKLHDLFIHAIDPSYEGDQVLLGKLHKPANPPYTGMRC